MITVLQRGVIAKWLQYYIGVGQQMVTVLHRGGLANDSSIPWILGYYIRNIISIDLANIQIFSFGKKSFLGRGVSIWLYLYIGWVWPNDYSITWGEGSLGTPKNDYVICARPLRRIHLDFKESHIHLLKIESEKMSRNFWNISAFLTGCVSCSVCSS